MFKICADAFAIPFLETLVENSIQQSCNSQFFYDQMHFVNMKFITDNLDHFTRVLVKALSETYPRCIADDFVYVNDFLAPVNLENAQIHTNNSSNAYGWHTDFIDRRVGPCYNVWIPLYCEREGNMFDDNAVLEVKNSTLAHDLGLDWFFNFDEFAPPGQNLARKIFDDIERPENATLVGWSRTNQRLLFLDKDFVHEDVKKVFKLEMGDALVFDSSQLHRSGPSSFARVGISIKFLYKPLSEDRFPSAPLPSNMPFAVGDWGRLFDFCWRQFGDYHAFLKYVPELILQDKNQEKILENMSKIESVVGELKKIKHVLSP
jgi:hypothetical protein